MDQDTKNAFETMSREELLRALEMFAKNWLAHDGCWFLAAEERFNMETAIELDARSWKRFAAAEARRIAGGYCLFQLLSGKKSGGVRRSRRGHDERFQTGRQSESPAGSWPGQEVLP